MSTSVLEIEQTIRKLPITEQLWLVEQIARSIRTYETNATQEPNMVEAEEELNAMALDPAIQAELATIDLEFSITDMDGLLEP